MTRVDATKFAKRIQSRLSSKGIKKSLGECREALLEVTNGNFPTDGQMAQVMEILSAAIEESEESTLATLENQATLTTDAWQEELNEPEQVVDQDQEPQPQTTAASSQMVRSEANELASPAPVTGGITQQEIVSAVENQFGKESVQTKAAIIEYIAQDTYSTAQELKSALEQLRQLKLDLLMKIVLDHNASEESNESLIKQALTSASNSRSTETQDFFKGLDNLVGQMKTEFGLT